MNLDTRASSCAPALGVVRQKVGRRQIVFPPVDWVLEADAGNQSDAMPAVWKGYFSASDFYRDVWTETQRLAMTGRGYCTLGNFGLRFRSVL